MDPRKVSEYQQYLKYLKKEERRQAEADARAAIAREECFERDRQCENQLRKLRREYEDSAIAGNPRPRTVIVPVTPKDALDKADEDCVVIGPEACKTFVPKPSITTWIKRELWKFINQ